MMSKSKNGESARNYFLECEQKVNQKQSTPALTIEQVLELNSKVIIQLQQKVEVLETEKQILLPKAQFVDKTFIDENNVMAKYVKSGHFKIKQTWSSRHQRHFDKIFATAKGKLLCFEIVQNFSLQLAS